MFLAQVDEYRAMSAALPVDQESLRILPVDPNDRWHRLLRAFALRKFVAPRDQVFLPRVAASVVTLLPPGYPTELTEESALDGIEFWTARGTSFWVDRALKSPDEITKDLLYGVYLHGDYGRWRASQRQRGYEEHALWLWTSGVERLTFAADAYVRDLVQRELIAVAEPL